MARSGYVILGHPADLGIEARGATLRDAFHNAAVALMSVILDLTTVTPRQSRAITIVASDIEQLLVKWLTEILYLYDGQDFVSKDFTINQLTTTRLIATARGEKFDAHAHRTKLEVKGVTYHQLVIREDNDGGMVRVYLDI